MKPLLATLCFITFITNPGAKADLVKMSGDQFVTNLRYAQENNCMGKAVYEELSPYKTSLHREPIDLHECWVHPQMAKSLEKVAAYLKKNLPKVKLLFWDCYRPDIVQVKLFEAEGCSKSPSYVATPKNMKTGGGSMHNIGKAVDISLADEDGKPLAMPSDHDEFPAKGAKDTKKTWLTYVCKNEETGATCPSPPKNLEKLVHEIGINGFSEKCWNRDLLQNLMTSVGGLKSISTEWWHFSTP